MFFGLSGLPVDQQEKIIKKWIDLKKENEKNIRENEKSKREMAIIELFKNDPTTSFNDMIVIGQLIAKCSVKTDEIGVNTEIKETRSIGTNTPDSLDNQLNYSDEKKEQSKEVTNSWFSW